jgi:transcriptional/translational regulatory protein YebC/TACO1
VAEDALIEVALEASADDVTTTGDTYDVLTPPARFESVREALVAKSIPIVSAEVTKLATLEVPVSEKEAEALLRLVDALEEHDDVQKVYANYTVPDEVMARLTR